MGCAIYLHGHSAGGTNPSLVEAMYRGLPVCAFDVDYNRASTDEKALFFSSAADLAKILQSVDDKSLQVLGVRMQNYAQSRYRWELVAEQYAQLIDSLAPPSTAH